MRWLRSLVKGGADELGWDDWVRRVARAVGATAHFGARGAVSFPPEVEVEIVAPTAGAGAARGFLNRPAFDRAVAAELENRWDCPASELPFRSYQVVEGEGLRVSARASAEAGEARWALTIEGGDRDGETLSIPPGRAEVRFGRGAWHGGDRQVKNDLAIADEAAFVSRRAGRLVAAGHGWEVESLDQGDLLAVERSGGESLRPARSASGRAALGAGDALELSDGGELKIRLILGRPRG